MYDKIIVKAMILGQKMETKDEMLAKEISGISKIVDYYDAFVLDVWGVVHDGTKPYPGAVDCINHLLSLDKKILFLSNLPRPGSILMTKLIEFGIKATPEIILTSGDMVKYQLAHFDDSVFKKLGKRFYHLGAERNQDIVSDLQVSVVNDLFQANFILLTAYLDQDEDLNKHDEILKKAIDLKLPLICANPDKEIVNGDKIRHCAGVLAARYEALGGIVYYYGKPYPAVYEMACKKFKEYGINNKKRILMVGDTLDTDIKGAKNAEIDSALVLCGNMGILLAEKNLENQSSPHLSQTILSVLKDQNIAPNWILPSLIY